jgi:hypothetical protein
MALSSSNLMVIVGETPEAHELRRTFARDGIPYAGVTTHLTGLRRALVVGAFRRVVLCLSLDETTLHRHGEEIRQVLADRSSFEIGLCSVGLLVDRDMGSHRATLGCDVYLNDWREAPATIDAMTAMPGFAAAESTLDRCINTVLADRVHLLRQSSWSYCKQALSGGEQDTGDVSWHRWRS